MQSPRECALPMKKSWLRHCLLDRENWLFLALLLDPVVDSVFVTKIVEEG